MTLKRHLVRVLDQLSSYLYISPENVHSVRTFLNSQQPLIRSSNTLHHVCVFFLPVHIPSRSVYLVDHIKAHDWIPPGGHIDGGESPIDTVLREFQEELSYKLTDENILPVQLTVKRIRSKRHPCRTHYDFWYAVEMDKPLSFVYDVNEFHGAGWFPLSEGLKRMKLPAYRKALSDSISYLFSRN